MFSCDPGTLYLYSQRPAAARLSIRCPLLTVDDPLLTADTWNPEAEAAAQAAGATLYLSGIDTAALKALPWTIDALAFERDGARISFSIAEGMEFLSPVTLCLRTRGERHYATLQEMACEP